MAFDVTVEPVLDLTDRTIYRALGVRRAQLVGNTDADIERCREAADFARHNEFRAILAPSAALDGETNFAIFPDGPPARLELGPTYDRFPMNY